MSKKEDFRSAQQPPVAAVGTPPGRSAVAVVRLSGKGCIDIAKKIFSPFPSKANELKHGTLHAEGFKDDAMCVYFSAPRSYTGEDMAEIHTHGGFFIAQAAVEACIAHGCRSAENGEFTKRAFLNGKLKLTEAEGVIEMIDGESRRAVNNGYNTLKGKLNERLLAIQDGLTDILASVEAALDYPEEDLEVSAGEQAKEILAQTEKLLETAKTGKLIKNGIDVVIVGDVNVGKSSLLNCLLGFDRAIVTDIAGTTRDTLSQSVLYRDVKFNFTDTAGLRETSDAVEKLGVERAEEAMKTADIILLVFDAEKVNTKPFERICKCEKTIVVFNKTDKKEATEQSLAGIKVSALTGSNVEKLKEEIYKKTKINKTSANDILLTNNRHIDCLTRTAHALRRVAENAQHSTMDCVAAELSEGLAALGEITGENTSEKVISRIFEKFCLGK